MKMPSQWELDPTLIPRLRALWDEGHSTAAIGRRLGVSKNSVVGKAHRLDLPSRPTPIIRNGEKREPRPRIHRAHRRIDTLPPLQTQVKIVPVLTIVPEVEPPPPAPKLRGTCQFITSVARPWVFCDDGALFGKSWCSVHFDRVYTRRCEAA